MKAASTPVTRLRDRFREETAQAILAAAEQVFAEDGLHARMERIASTAGVAVGTLYNHFRDRESLLAALSASRRQALLERLDAALRAADGRPFGEQLRAFLDAFVEHARIHGRFLSALVQVGEGPARARAPATLLDEMVGRAERLVERGVAAGALRGGDSLAFAGALVGMVRTAVVLALEGRCPFDGIAASVSDLFLRGVHA
ncbi:TetR/AcrR family transcriptional regulator [Anaeromyxobacter oryzisoli]|uniref:TetR/AcrR family transcriptional regulator n=1 Tax=Anaeromyxobacter oryzisoli TaxID=2925408 RepID=UPI001F5979CA|nr:TetR/AcrR family transcriptional regulator [Anaeromyxobacter sp. SG63]